ncbi:hypothetical protein PoB_006311200 [Plakobranchus ocellatus]|uniref:Uncharacterized protein n=1 Tax=Plakobranchus ocellatus TaxID=259542 RepID=A0AAV4CXE7_9GAST|nr:hypothetical protein PoB_006311200 [Plakobranchus ocellatus]
MMICREGLECYTMSGPIPVSWVTLDISSIRGDRLKILSHHSHPRGNEETGREAGGFCSKAVARTGLDGRFAVRNVIDLDSWAAPELLKSHRLKLHVFFVEAADKSKATGQKAILNL